MQDMSRDTLLEIAWNQDFSVGDVALDQDHKRFIAMVNELNQAIICEEKWEQIRRRLKLIILDAKDHFAHEQLFLVEHGYQDAAHHAVLHTKLMGDIIEAMALIRHSELRERWIEAGLHIKALLIDHLLNEDMQFRNFLNKSEG